MLLGLISGDYGLKAACTSWSASQGKQRDGQTHKLITFTCMLLGIGGNPQAGMTSKIWTHPHKNILQLTNKTECYILCLETYWRTQLFETIKGESLKSLWHLSFTGIKGVTMLSWSLMTNYYMLLRFALVLHLSTASQKACNLS